MKRITNLIKNSFAFKFLILFVFFTVVHYAMGYHFKLFYVLAITSLLIAINKYNKTYKIIILFYSIIASLYLPVGLLYSYPDYNIFSSFYYTNNEEARGFLTNINYKYYLLSILLFASSFFIINLKFNINKNSKIIFTFLFLVITFISPIKAISSSSWRLLLTSGIPEIRFFTESIFYLDYLAKEKKSIEGSDTFEISNVKPKYKIYVVVIGESARRDFMHNYGLVEYSMS